MAVPCLKNNNCVSPLRKKIAAASNAAKQRVLDIFPEEMTIKKEKTADKINKIGRYLSPAENRLILGASALLSQPFIDASNKRVDKETRKVSVARTCAKIIAGTLTGFFIRKGCIKLVEHCSVPFYKNPPKWRSIFTPTEKVSGKVDNYRQYKNAFGNIMALTVMLFTNFLIDAPLTKFLTNFFVKKSGGENETSK